MNGEKRQQLRKNMNVIWRIYSVSCFVQGILILAYLHWDTYWYGLKQILFGLFFWNPDKVWSLVKQKVYQKK
jgi:hypothetical protein